MTEENVSSQTNTEAENCSGSCSSCGVDGCASRTSESSGAAFEKLSPNKNSNIKKTIAVVSGKGGVGKSLVCSLLASELQRKGYKVGILDADVTGPSIPKSFGLTGELSIDNENMINPLSTPEGIKAMSANMLLPLEDTPVAWRGPVITNALAQFWTEVNWGDIDIMLIDMPPGTSDVFLTILQMFPVDGIISVSAPQDLVSMIVGKAVNLAGSMNVPVLGLVENMSYFKCENCDEIHHIFGESQVEGVAAKYKIEATATLPINPQYADKVDAGKVTDIAIEGALDPIIKQIENA